MRFFDRLAERAVRARMESIDSGTLTVHHRGSRTDYGDGSEPRASVTIHQDEVFWALALGGHVGAAETYVRGLWSVDDLTALIRVFALNRETLDGLETGWARLSQPLLALLRLRHRNTRRGSRSNIHAHYDLGNEFFASFLDETLTYSAGYFPHEDATLRDASVEKYDRICRKLDLGPDDHVVEIGSGWGGFAIHAATEFGCRVTTTTISRAQHRLATERVAAAGLAHRVTVLDRDYRDLDGEYDKLVSIEMVEAVGHQYLTTFYETCARLLRPDGRAALQVITVRDDWYDPRQRQVDFIKRYIFPGSFIPSIAALTDASSHTDLRLVHLEDITPHYTETLRRWRARFEEGWAHIRGSGFDEEFRRLWRFYLCYCEGGFAEAILGSIQLVYAKPLWRGSIDVRNGNRVEAVA